jgi:hypothetical protein
MLKRTRSCRNLVEGNDLERPERSEAIERVERMERFEPPKGRPKEDCDLICQKIFFARDLRCHFRVVSWRP